MGIFAEIYVEILLVRLKLSLTNAAWQRKSSKVSIGLMTGGCSTNTKHELAALYTT